ncbi:glycoside hydrolase family 61 protein [Phialemonium atrogriseum]|uniref:lytic cellulose monooxygenase (C4-dehydrogenating) n=1 Tax=Phialemonium atrogriseum TaxID=1093897 RepID=A0AAJ0BRM2_9PEZI|nr:glycoside hydrolase family 61 protein [Phialemonium atrogriseum]KAK1762970.1 glycoside hydrolase family 61 protein [Phialemonium atrogriseum]
MVQRAWASITPIFSVNDPFLACNDPGTPPPSYIPISAGDNLTAVYWYWLHPVGPMTVWLTACGADCSTVDVNEAEWFKIWEAGLLIGNVPQGMWYQKNFQEWDGSPDIWPVTIPLSLKPGLYMVRHEILSLHIQNKPQFYPECAHLNITGTGTAFPPDDFLKKFPGAYDENDPSIKIDIYTDEMKKTENYTIPGGPIWSGFTIQDKYCLGC